MNVLKNPVLDDSVLLEASAIGQYLHTDYIRSQSTPSIANMTEEELENVQSRNFAPFNHEYQPADAGYGTSHARRGSEGGIHAYRVQVSDSSDPRASSSNPYTSTSGNMINNWVAGLPEYGKRSRSHTDPMRHLLLVERGNSPESPSKAKTLPNNLSLQRNHGEEDICVAKDDAQAEDGSLSVVEATSPAHVSPVNTSASKKTSVRSSVSSPGGGGGGLDTRALQPQSPATPVTPNSKLVKIFMSKVQKGEELDQKSL